MLPGYQGYVEREGRRQTDKILREEISSILGLIEKALNRKILNEIEVKNKELVSYFDTILKKIGLLQAKIKFAPYGESSFFSDNQIKEDELREIYIMDSRIKEEADSLFNIFYNNELSQNNNIEKLKASIEEKINTLEILLEKRNNFIKNFK